MSESSYHRGDLVVAAFSGDYGKPRPAIVVQSDLFNADHESILLCPITSEIMGGALFRIQLPVSSATGLRAKSEAMVDKLTVTKRRRIGRRIGRLSPEQMKAVDQALRIWLDLPGLAY